MVQGTSTQERPEYQCRRAVTLGLRINNDERNKSHDPLRSNGQELCLVLMTTTVANVFQVIINRILFGYRGKRTESWIIRSFNLRRRRVYRSTHSLFGILFSHPTLQISLKAFQLFFSSSSIQIHSRYPNLEAWYPF